MAKPHVTLKYTSTVSEEEFHTRCAVNDSWYHSYYFDNGFAQPGHYDIGCDVGDYGFPDDMSGMSVLDVGTATGWFAAYFEQRGADVTAVDIRGECDADIFGCDPGPDAAPARPPERVLPDGREIHYNVFSRGFWIMKDILGLKAEFFNVSIYDLRPKLFGGRKFDLVFIGSVLMHVRDPIGALMGARRVCKNQLIATSFLRDSRRDEGVPLMQQVSDVHPASWWIPNRPCLLRWLEGAGFTNYDIDRTVRLTVDQVVAEFGEASANKEHLQLLIHAFV